jgi:hypothetical protein
MMTVDIMIPDFLLDEILPLLQVVLKPLFLATCHHGERVAVEDIHVCHFSLGLIVVCHALESEGKRRPFSNFSAVRDSSVTGVADDTLIIYSTAA